MGDAFRSVRQGALRAVVFGPATAHRNVHRSVRAHLWGLALITLLSACASTPPTPVDSAKAGIQSVPPGAPRGEESTFQGRGGASLAYVSYRSPGARSALVVLNGLQGHAGWFASAAGELRERGYDVYCIDRRGSGLNRENRGFVSGHIDAYETWFADIQAFVRPLRQRYDDVVLVGVSWGGRLAVTYGLKHSEDLDALVLVAPWLRTRKTVDLPTQVGVLLSQPFTPERAVSIPIEPELYTTEPSLLDYLRHDPLRLESASVTFFYESHQLRHHIFDQMSGKQIPVQLILAGDDAIVDNDRVLTSLRQARRTSLDVVNYEHQSHAIALDVPEKLAEDIDRWLDKTLREE